MKLGIMQPYFFPGLGYFDLIRLTDRWLVFDIVQYRRHSWMNRNRILHPSSGWSYIIASLEKHARETLIRDIKLSPDPAWREHILGQLRHYQKRAPGYAQTVDLVRECFGHSQASLVDLNVFALAKVCERLEIVFRPEVFSALDLQLGPVEGPGDWALRIAEALRATEYINPPGGAKIFDGARFEAAEIKLTIRHFSNMEYTCRGYPFIPGLSILDILMWNTLDVIKAYLSAAASHNEPSESSDPDESPLFSPLT